MVLAVIAVLVLFFFWPVILAGVIIFLIWIFWPEKKWQCLGCNKKFHRENSCKEHTQNCEENRQREEEIDNDKFLESYAEKAIKSWKGLKVKHLPVLMPADITKMDAEEAIEIT